MNIVFFTSNLDFNVRWNVVTLAGKFPQAQFTIVQHAPQKRVGRLVRNQWRKLKRHGLRWILFDIKRTGINWAFDLTTLHARLRGWDNTQ
jgi:hypothetical protein